MPAASQTIPPPSKALLLLEGRAIHELGAFLTSLPLLSLARNYGLRDGVADGMIRLLSDIAQRSRPVGLRCSQLIFHRNQEFA
jgi:hypothetical protein